MSKAQNKAAKRLAKRAGRTTSTVLATQALRHIANAKAAGTNWDIGQHLAAAENCLVGIV